MRRLRILAAAGAAAAQDKVIYHFDSGLTQATKGLRNIRNHLEVDPKAKIVVVAHADGVEKTGAGAPACSTPRTPPARLRSAA